VDGDSEEEDVEKQLLPVDIGSEDEDGYGVLAMADDADDNKVELGSFSDSDASSTAPSGIESRGQEEDECVAVDREVNGDDEDGEDEDDGEDDGEEGGEVEEDEEDEDDGEDDGNEGGEDEEDEEGEDELEGSEEGANGVDIDEWSGFNTTADMPSGGSRGEGEGSEAFDILADGDSESESSSAGGSQRASQTRLDRHQRNCTPETSLISDDGGRHDIDSNNALVSIASNSF
jgi:hypothetical protein